MPKSFLVKTAKRRDGQSEEESNTSAGKWNIYTFNSCEGLNVKMAISFGRLLMPFAYTDKFVTQLQVCFIRPTFCTQSELYLPSDY